MLLRLAVIGGGKAAKLSYLTCSHSLKLFGRLFYTHAYEDVFESEDVFAEGSTSLIIRPGIVSFKINRNGFVSHSFFFFSLWVLFVCLFYCCFGVFLSCSGYVWTCEKVIVNVPPETSVVPGYSTASHMVKAKWHNSSCAFCIFRLFYPGSWLSLKLMMCCRRLPSWPSQVRVSRCECSAGRWVEWKVSHLTSPKAVWQPRGLGVAISAFMDLCLSPAEPLTSFPLLNNPCSPRYLAEISSCAWCTAIADCLPCHTSRELLSSSELLSSLLSTSE